MIIWLIPTAIRIAAIVALSNLLASRTGWLLALFICAVVLTCLNLVLFTSRLFLVLSTAERDRRARKVLISWLPWHMKLYFLLNAKLRVKGTNGNRYHIIPRRENAIRCGIKWYCGYPLKVPRFDAMLAQYLVLKNDPQYFHQKAYPASW